jgi:hypothetical protein
MEGKMGNIVDLGGHRKAELAQMMSDPSLQELDVHTRERCRQACEAAQTRNVVVELRAVGSQIRSVGGEESHLIYLTNVLCEVVAAITRDHGLGARDQALGAAIWHSDECCEEAPDAPSAPSD